MSVHQGCAASEAAVARLELRRLPEQMAALPYPRDRPLAERLERHAVVGKQTRKLAHVRNERVTALGALEYRLDTCRATNRLRDVPHARERSRNVERDGRRRGN